LKVTDFEALAGGVGRQRIGLLGGSFNPAHDGHLYISVEALKRLQLDAVWWLVSPQNPLKAADGMAPLAERAASARAVARHPRIRVTTIEAQMGTRYTVDTIARLRQQFPATRFVWLMGSDNLAQMPQWRRWTQIFNTVSIAVFARETYDFKALAGIAAHRYSAHRQPVERAASLATRTPPAWTFVPLRRHPAASTDIRLTGEWSSK
jgi:nicotinate-nucleotide adenylyltransferase